MELTYSNDFGAAILTQIIRSFEQHYPGSQLGRTAMQKLTYFAKIVGVNVPYSFEIYTYGPYCDEITFTIDSLVVDEVVHDRSEDRGHSAYRLGPQADVLLGEFAAELGPFRPRIDLVVKAFGRFDTKQLELIATLHFVCRKHAQLFRRQATQDDALREFVRIKGDKFTPHDIKLWYASLKKAGLV